MVCHSVYPKLYFKAPYVLRVDFDSILPFTRLSIVVSVSDSEPVLQIQCLTNAANMLDILNKTN